MVDSLIGSSDAPVSGPLVPSSSAGALCPEGRGVDGSFVDIIFGCQPIRLHSLRRLITASRRGEPKLRSEILPAEDEVPQVAVGAASCSYEAATVVGEALLILRPAVVASGGADCTAKDLRIWNATVLAAAGFANA